MKLATRYTWSIVLGRVFKKIKRVLKKAAPRFELGIKDLQSSALPLGHAAEVKNGFHLGDRISQSKQDVLVISNGHGEDLIAFRILEELHSQSPGLKLEVLPLVGEGKVFDKAVSQKWLVKIPLLSRLPSGGFSNQSFRGFLADICAGMVYLSIKQWIYVRWAARQGRVILAVGDLLPLVFAWSSGGVFAFVGTPKSDYTWSTAFGSLLSDYFHRIKGTEWDPWECALMRSPRCKFVGTRDKLTARGLRRKSIKAFAPGNPMMDCFEQIECPDQLKSCRRLLLLCGSRMPEALVNLRRLMAAALQIKTQAPLAILVATGSEPTLKDVELCLKGIGFRSSVLLDNQLQANSLWEMGLIKVFIGRGKFFDWAPLAEVGLANAGTATEQLVGLGKPCISLPGDGPQFKKSFAIRQSRLLGGAVMPCQNTRHFAQSAETLLEDHSLRHKLSIQGVKRMGNQGGSAVLAAFVLKLLVGHN